jgi:hypothetical protein
VVVTELAVTVTRDLSDLIESKAESYYKVYEFAFVFGERTWKSSS